ASRTVFIKNKTKKKNVPVKKNRGERREGSETPREDSDSCRNFKNTVRRKKKKKKT
uniref:Uncharacterized protein n=2 Tax=Ixodes scapularis TaxID=6945 RepID=A0A1S4KVV4_IXOSC